MAIGDFVESAAIFVGGEMCNQTTPILVAKKGRPGCSQRFAILWGIMQFVWKSCDSVGECATKRHILCEDQVESSKNKWDHGDGRLCGKCCELCWVIEAFSVELKRSGGN